MLDGSRGENSHRHPQFLPDGRHFLFSARCSQRENDALYVGSLGSPERKLILPLSSNAIYVVSASRPGGWLLFFRDGTLFAQSFDAGDLRLSGEPVPVTEDVEYIATSRIAAFAASSGGRALVYRSGSAALSQFTWFDRRGRSLGTLGPPGVYSQLRLSPDGKRALFSRPDEKTGNRDVWFFETARGVATRLTSHPSNDWFPVWSPDGSRVLFGTDRHGGPNMVLYEKKSLDANAPEEPIAGKVEGSRYDWSMDGRWIAFGKAHQPQPMDIWVVPLFGDRKPFPFLETAFEKGSPRFSPDSKWIAYVSNETGRHEVYARAFRGTEPASGVTRQISTGGGDYPIWSRDGKELFYISGDSMLNAVTTTKLAESESAPPPVALFRPCAETRMNAGPLSGLTYTDPYDVSADGRFLFNCSVGKPAWPTIVVNWQTDIEPRK